jgi:hypothetical protein
MLEVTFGAQVKKLSGMCLLLSLLSVEVQSMIDFNRFSRFFCPQCTCFLDDNGTSSEWRDGEGEEGEEEEEEEEEEREKIINNASLLVLDAELHHRQRSIADYFHSKRVCHNRTRFQHTIQSPKSTDRLNKR